MVLYLLTKGPKIKKKKQYWVDVPDIFYFGLPNGGVTNRGLRGVRPPFPEIAFFALLRRVQREIQKTEEKGLFLRYPQICLNPHLLNSRLRHSNCFFSSGRGKGECEAPGGGGGVLLKIPGGGGGFSRGRRGREGACGELGILGGGGAKHFFFRRFIGKGGTFQNASKQAKKCLKYTRNTFGRTLFGRYRNGTWLHA